MAEVTPVDLASAVRTWPDYLVVGLLLITASAMFVVSARVSSARQQKLTHDSPGFWVFCGATLIIFAAIKSLNMLAFVGAWFRELTKASGAYDGRRPVQLLALAGIGMLLVLISVGLAATPGLARRHWQIILGMALLAAFGAARFVSLHDFDSAMRAAPWLRLAAESLIGLFCLAYTMQAYRQQCRKQKTMPNRCAISSDER